MKGVTAIQNHKGTLKRMELEREQNLTAIKAASIQKSGLRRKRSFQLCPNFLAGSCRNHDAWHGSHEICQIVGVESEPTISELPIIPNYLSTNPRVAPSNGWAFEDGPGQLSSAGPRHQNDFVNIQDVNILPTVDEILSLRTPYVPKKDASHPHRLPIGQSRLIDINFRQLRYDSTESIIDICYHASQCLISISSEPFMSDYDTRKKTPIGNQYSLFQDITFTHSQHEPKGTMIDVSFSCPLNLREKNLYASKELEEGTLAALIGLDKEGTALSITFLEIRDIKSTEGIAETDKDDLRG